ncbi:hypothetical protein C7M84_019357 [Penaeus vannamei]|uniref:Integrase catalytic domain-containing protein n=1 Tax=Penaeus vannamei TaxID=6689 RepID=A0A3R7MIT2_PENVA|nr:hypothetical protein C7M84_019357 [Penaeus vannamei]
MSVTDACGPGGCCVCPWSGSHDAYNVGREIARVMELNPPGKIRLLEPAGQAVEPAETGVYVTSLNAPANAPSSSTPLLPIRVGSHDLLAFLYSGSAVSIIPTSAFDKHPFILVDGPTVSGDVLLRHDFMASTGLYQVPRSNIAVHGEYTYSLTPPGRPWLSSHCHSISTAYASNTSPADIHSISGVPDTNHNAAPTTAPTYKPCTPPSRQVKPSSTATAATTWTPTSDYPFCQVSRTTVLPPYTDCAVPVCVPPTAGTLLVLPEGVRVHGLAALPAIYDAPDDLFSLRLMNVTDSPVRLERATRVLDCEATHLPVVISSDLAPSMHISHALRQHTGTTRQDTRAAARTFGNRRAALIFPDFDQPFTLATDASYSGLGAALMQKVDGRLRPIAYASRKLNAAERHYSVTDMEALAVVWSLKHFREIILGYNIEVLTDHQIQVPMQPPGPLDRHITRIQPHHLLHTRDDVRLKQRADPIYGELTRALEADPPAPLPSCRSLPRRWSAFPEVCTTEKTGNATETHLQPASHTRITSPDGTSGSTLAPAPALTYTDRPFLRVSVDILSGFPASSSGNRYMLVFIDAFWRYCELVPIPNKSANTVARAFLERIICRHSTPDEIISDNGKEISLTLRRSTCYPTDRRQMG